MFRVVVLIVVLLGVCSSSTIAQEPEKEAKAKQMRAEIAELKAKLAKLEKELADLDDPEATKRDVSPVKITGGLHYTLEIGERGNFGEYQYQVEEVIDESTVRLSVARGKFTFLVKGVETKRLADGLMVQMPGVWEVTGTKKQLSTTYFVVEPKNSGKLVRVK